MHLLRIQIAPMADDLKRATDLVVTVEGGDIAVRIRRPSCSYRDLTIRAWRRSGAKTEIDKIRKGFARWYLYAWSDGHYNLADWILVDLDNLRQSGLLNDERPIIYNPDRRTGFKAYTVKELAAQGCLVASSLYHGGRKV